MFTRVGEEEGAAAKIDRLISRAGSIGYLDIGLKNVLRNMVGLAKMQLTSIPIHEIV